VLNEFVEDPTKINFGLPLDYPLQLLQLSYVSEVIKMRERERGRERKKERERERERER
jgi:hypothetical protein